MIDFVGIGAQKAGTSWVYACLYEHPDICAPIKEIHFFSRPRYTEGTAWYDAQFQECKTGQMRGEFSTSYAYSSVAAERIKVYNPAIKIIFIVRNPFDRAYSQYRNAIKGGEIAETVSFNEYQTSDPSCLAQGLYWQQLERYRQHFSDEQIKVLVYDDSLKDPQAFMTEIYQHIGVEPAFVPPSLMASINVARTPKNYRIDKGMHYLAEWLRRQRLGRLVHAVKRSGVTDFIRARNTKPETAEVDTAKSSMDIEYFRDDILALGEYLERDLVSEWQP